jgi:PAB-dependent poly(A)-specific ribonuclease subunit 2
MVQNLARFLLDRVSQEYKSIPPASTALEAELFSINQPANHHDLAHKVLATSAMASIRCTSCKNESTRMGTNNVIDLMYPPPPKPVRGGKAARVTFSQALKMGIERETNSKGWCKTCNRYHQLQMRKTLQSIPAVMAINTVITSLEHRRLWSTTGWLPEEIGVIMEAGQFFCFEGRDLELHLQRGIHKIAVYSLIGMVVSVESPPPQKPHLVATVNGKCPGQVYLIVSDFCSGPFGPDPFGGKPMVPIQRLFGSTRTEC